MRPQSRDLAGPEQPRERRSEQQISRRAQRKIAEEQAERRKRLMLLGGGIAAALILALVGFLVTRPGDIGAPVLAEPLPASIPVKGMSMGSENAPVTVTEWGDFT